MCVFEDKHDTKEVGCLFYELPHSIAASYILLQPLCIESVSFAFIAFGLRFEVAI